MKKEIKKMERDKCMEPNFTIVGLQSCHSDLQFYTCVLSSPLNTRKYVRLQKCIYCAYHHMYI